MESDFKTWLNSVVTFLTNRFFLLFLAFIGMFYILVINLFEIQIVNGESYLNTVTKTELKPVTIKAPRGSIYDSYGRPLATNEIAFTVKINPNMKKEGKTETIIKFVKLMQEHGESIAQTLPITLGEPHTFDFNNDIDKEKRWKKRVGIKENATANEAYDELRKIFLIPEDMSDEEAWQPLNVLVTIYLESGSNQSITIAFDIKEITVAALEEKNYDFPGIQIDIDYLRKYPQGENFSHALGYIRKISETELANYSALEGYEYDETSIVGKSGLEQAFELELKGKDGSEIIEVDDYGRQVTTVNSNNLVLPIQGNNVITTLDSHMQNKAYEYLEKMLRDILLNKLRGTSAKEKPYTAKEIIVSMTKANNISISDLMVSKDGTRSNKIKNYILNNFLVDEESNDYVKNVTQFILDSIENNNISISDIMMIMYEQNLITLTENQERLLSSGSINLSSLIIDKVETGEITPQMVNLDPSTGSVVLVNVNTGAVIAAASYPTYDNNQLVNNFNNKYFNKINNDPTAPQIYRAFSSPSAPGSTFKMVTALAALDSGAITADTAIVDKGTFTDAGIPYISDMIRTSGFHGMVDVKKALEVSCNFFFSTVSYSFGNAKKGTTEEGINLLNKYITDLGLNSATGIELDDYAASSSSYKTSLLEYKERIELGKNKNAPASDLRWKDGNTVAMSIGQYINNYTPASMAKYVATIANGGNRYPLHFLDTIVSSEGTIESKYQAVPELVLDVKESDINTIHEGMLRVTSGSEGTGRNVFKDFPIKVGGKTGTAEEFGSSHSSFAGFAPYDNPQIAIYVNIPKGDTLTTRAPAAQVARDVIGAYFGLDTEIQLPEIEKTLAK